MSDKLFQFVADAESELVFVRHHIQNQLSALSVVALLLVLVVQTSLSAQTNTGPVAPQAPPVKVNFLVTDNKNHFVDGLNKEDIKVFVHDVEQPLLLFEWDERPIHYAITIDTSGSFKKLMAAELEAVSVIISNNRSSDEVFIERFINSDKIETLQDFTNDQNALLASLKRAQVEGGQSAVLDALYLAIDHTANRGPKDDRKAVIIITDGEDRSSFYSLDKVVDLLHQTRVPVFIIGMVFMLDDDNGLIRVSPRTKAEKLLTTIADESGGRVFFAKDVTELSSAVSEIVHDLRGQYLVAFQPTENKASQKLKIEIVKAAGREGWKAHHIRGVFPPAKTESKATQKAKS
jgi:Ca-activated chloride channel family protein